jgi:hypothetical protein
MKKSMAFFFAAAFITLLGGIYNVVERDFIGASIFLVSSVVLLAVGIQKSRSISRGLTLNSPCRYSDGKLIEKGDAVLRDGVVPARIIDVFDGSPPSVWLEDAESPGNSFHTAELSDLTLIERNSLDFARAGVDWLGTQADSGDAAAQAALGWLCEAGVAIERDDARAVALYARAAQGGDPVGQFNFALRCEYGRGIETNLAEAARWYLAAAEQGVGPAMKNLSNMYRDGRGVEQDVQQAIRWLREAEAEGCA